MSNGKTCARGHHLKLGEGHILGSGLNMSQLQFNLNICSGFNSIIRYCTDMTNSSRLVPNESASGTLWDITIHRRRNSACAITGLFDV